MDKILAAARDFAANLIVVGWKTGIPSHRSELAPSPTRRVIAGGGGVVNELPALALALAACFGAAGVGGFVTSRSLNDWYLHLPKPSWNPPNRVFGPVWSVLYLLMGIAVWLVWIGRDGHDITTALAWFAGQLALNLLWSLVFFGLRSPAGGLLVIVALWCAIAATIFAFAPLSAVAAALLIPYLLWVSFATLLNAAIARNVRRSPAA